MEYYRSHRLIEADKESLSSFKDGSLTSDLDDLTVIAEFDNISEYDDDVSTYRLSPSYELVGCSLRRKSSLKESPKMWHDTNIQTDDSIWRHHYNTFNKTATPTNHLSTRYPTNDINNNNIKTNTKSSNINTNSNNIDNNINTNNNNLMDGKNSSNNSTLRTILDTNEAYDTDDFDGVVEKNLKLNGENNSTSATWDEVDRKQPKPKSYNTKLNDVDINNVNKLSNHNVKSTGTDPINFGSPTEIETQNPTKPQSTLFFHPSSKKNSTSFYVPLDEDTGFYEDPNDRTDLTKTSTRLTREKASQTIEEFTGINKSPREVTAKKMKDESTMTLRVEKTQVLNASTSTVVVQQRHQDTGTDAAVTNVDFMGLDGGGGSDDVYKQMEELMKETEDLYVQLENETESKKQKERQYEELMKDHENVLSELNSLKQDLDSLKRLAEKEREKKPLQNQTNRAAQTEATSRVDVAVQGTSMDDSQMMKDLHLLQERVQLLENELERKQTELDSLASELDQKQSEIGQLAEQNDSLNEELDQLNNQIPNNDEIEKLKIDVSTSEQNALETNQKLQKVLEDTLKDLKTAEQKLNQANQQLQNKDRALKDAEERVDEFENREGDLDRIVGNLKTEINNLNEKISEASKKAEEMENPNLSQTEHEEALMAEISRLMSTNAELNDALLDNNLHNPANDDLTSKYNDLRNISSRLQTAVSPLKAKISLANKKLNEKNELMDALMKSSAKGGKMEQNLAKRVEESIGERPRPLSPLTINHIDRMEHDLINHLRDSFPGHPSDGHLNRSTHNLRDPYASETPSGATFNDISEDHLDLSGRSLNNSKLVSLFDQPDSTLFDDKRYYSRPDKASKLKSPTRFETNRSAALIDTVSSYSNKPPLDSHLLLTKSLKADVLGNKAPGFDGNSISSRLHPSRYLRSDEPMLPRSTLTSYNDTPPPRDFQIDRMEGRRRLLFCWEPPLDRATNSPVVGYELYVSGRNHASIKGKQKNKFQLDLPPSLTLPSTFSLLSKAADGQLSAPSKIILHGLHHNKSGPENDGGASVKSAIKGDNLKLRSSIPPPRDKSRSSNMQKRMYVAFFDFKSSGLQMEVNGRAYNELSFTTGDLIEAFCDVMPNGYVLGKIKGSNVEGLVPANFLEKPS